MAKKTYTREFKLKVARAVESGALRPAQACREYQIAASVMNRWHQKVRLRGADAFTPLDPPAATTDYETRISELERVCGQLAVENAALKKRCSVSSPSPASAHEQPAPGVSQVVDSPALRAAGGQPILGVYAPHARTQAERDVAFRDAIEHIVLEFPG
jgi:transposase-like protein